MNSRFVVRRLLLVAFVFLLAGCAVASKPSISGTELSPGESSGLLARLAERDGQIQHMRALARVDSRTANDRSLLRYAIAFAKPDSLRVEMFPTTAAYTLALLTVNSERFVFLDAGAKKAYVAPPTAAAMGRVLKIPRGVDQLVSLVSGTIPGAILARPESVKVFSDQATGVVSMLSSNGSFFARLDQTTLDVARVELRDQFNEELLVAIDYKSYREVDGRRFPDSLVFHFIADDSELDLQLTTASFKSRPSDDLFASPIPESYETTTIAD